MGESLGDRVRELRLAKGWSVADLAAAAGISMGYVSLIENNRRRNTPLRTLTGLATALGVPVSELLPRGSGAGWSGSDTTSEVEDSQWRAFMRSARDLNAEERGEILEYIRFKRSQRRRQE